MDGTVASDRGAPDSPPTDPPAVRLTDVTKSFNGVEVLHGVDFELRRGEVHALLGGNGAGKSTLMKILEGVYTHDSGTIEIQGRRVQVHSAATASDLGVAMIFQEFSLVPTLTVAQNIFLTREARTGLGLLDDRTTQAQAAAILEDMGVDIDPRARLERLSTGAWQLTEIAKALSHDAQVLIMDEPTASLTATETDALFRIIGRLRDQGLSVVYISHRMDEVFRIADRVTVLRDGRVVGTHPVAEVTMEQLIEMIVGKQVESAFQWQERSVDRSVAPVLEAIDLAAPPKLNGVSLAVYPGEIVGIAGLMGSGRSEFVRALFGIDAIRSGEIRLNGQRIHPRYSGEAVREGLGLIPEDRRAQGLVLDHSVRRNLVLPLLDRLSRRGMMQDTRADEVTRSAVDDLNIRLASIHQPVKLLSGGNQQKVVLGKWLAADPTVLLMDEPTAGVDIGAKGEIIATIRRLADAGKAIVLISSELPEMLATCDRIAVMRSGRIHQILDRRDIEDEKQLQQILHQEEISA